MPIDTKNMIFVFGSNLAGIHGAGAAEYAMLHRGAMYGMFNGRAGQSYAIPTKGVYRGRVGHTLQLPTIRYYVDDFLRYAARHHELQFQVTAIGCGLAGLRHEDVAPMFADATDNCWFDSQWQGVFDEQYFGKKFKYWGTF